MGTTLTIDWNSDANLDTTISHTLLGASGLTGCTATFYAKKSLTDADAAAFLTTSASITTVGSNTTDGVITTALAAADTASLPRYTTVLYWRLKVVDASNQTSIADEGQLVVRVS